MKSVARSFPGLFNTVTYLFLSPSFPLSSNLLCFLRLLLGNETNCFISLRPEVLKRIHLIMIRDLLKRSRPRGHTHPLYIHWSVPFRTLTYNFSSIFLRPPSGSNCPIRKKTHFYYNVLKLSIILVILSSTVSK